MLFEITGNNIISYYYDENGSLLGLRYNHADYWYVKNLQGDIIGILNNAGTQVVAYTYDTWGKLISITGTAKDTVGVANPYRYRGYRYDTESGLYYLNARYYNPEWGRWINPEPNVYKGEFDDGAGLLGYNVYAYCANNPVIYVDQTGYVVTPANIIGAVIGGIVGAVGGYFLSRFLADKLKLKGWKRTVFIAGVSTVITAAAAVIGYFIGPYIAKLGKLAFNSLKKALIRSACFVAGTQVLTDTGHVPIEDISPGDLVWAENLETGEKGLKPVVEVFVNETHTLVIISTRQENIITTEEHPFWVVGKGWTEAKELFEGDTLLMQSGATTQIVAVSVECLSEPITVYNFEVKDWHNYYVSNSDILVHNDCTPKFVRKSAGQIEKMLGAKSGMFHRTIKPDILKSVGKKVLSRVGSNPDILVAQDGTIQLVSTVKKGISFVTDLNIYDFIP